MQSSYSRRLWISIKYYAFSVDFAWFLFFFILAALVARAVLARDAGASSHAVVALAARIEQRQSISRPPFSVEKLHRVQPRLGMAVHWEHRSPATRILSRGLPGLDLGLAVELGLRLHELVSRAAYSRRGERRRRIRE